MALTALCVIGVSSASAQTVAFTYTVTDLGVLPDQKDNSSRPAALNDQGQVAGTAGTSAFRYTNGGKPQMEDLGKETVTSIARGFGINSPGQVVGDSTFGKTQVSHAAIFVNGAAIDLGTLKKAGAFSRANGINASHQAVGFAGDQRDGQNSRAFIIDTSNRFNHLVDLGTLGGAYAQAWAINDTGFVTGNSQTSDHITTSPVSHAFIWSTKGMYDLGTIGGDFSYGTAINSNNHIAGYSTIDAGNNRVHAFLQIANDMVDLGSLSGASLEMDYSYAFGVNVYDQVVGYTYLPVNGPWSVAFVYTNGLMQNLNDLIGDAANNYRLDCATAINDNGEIVAIAYDNSAEAFHAVLLTPESAIPLKP